MGSKWNYSGIIAVSVIVLAAVIFGCTKEVPLAPVYTGEDTWTPPFEVYYNNYKRISVKIDGAPLSLLRNLSGCEVQMKLSTADSFETLASISLPLLAEGTYVTAKDNIEMGLSYDLRVAVTYRTGVVRYSRDTTVTSPVVHGEILKSICPAQTAPSRNFWFERGKIVFGFEGSGWSTVDTSTGTTSHVNTPMPLPWTSRFTVSDPIALSGDTAYYGPFLPNYIDAEEGLRVLRYNLETGWADSSLKLVRGPGHFSMMVADGKKIATWWVINYDLPLTVIEYEAETGSVLDSCQVPLPAPLSWIAGSAYRGDKLWVNCVSSRGYNKIGRIDFSTGQIVEMHDNPEFESAGLACDGANFWVLSYDDSGPSSYDKLLLVKD